MADGGQDGRVALMAIYRFEAKVISRGSGGSRSAVASASYRSGKFANGGKSAVSAAAYRAGAQLTDERTGQSYDYTNKRGVMGAEIMVPEGAVPWMRDRQELWAAVERIEKRRDAQLARDFILTLPAELSQAQRVALTREFVAENFCARGLVADIAWHAPGRGGDERNFHAHVMVPMRRIEGDQFAAKKDRPVDGAHPAKAWVAELEALRLAWANTANRHLEAAGLDIRLDHRSLAERGIDREPEPKLGPLATQIERQGRASLAGNDNREVKARNAELAALKIAQAETLAEEARLVELVTQRVRRGEMKLEPPSEEELRQQQAQEVERLAELRQQEARQAFKQRADEEAEEAKRRKEELEKEDARRQQAGEIADARIRYGIALADNYRVADPYGSLAQASLQEYGAFLKGQERLKIEISNEPDADRRRVIELRKEIEAHDYMAITSQRLGGISATIAGRENAPQAILDYARAEAHAGRAGELREERVSLIADLTRREQAQHETAPSRDPSDPGRGNPTGQTPGATQARTGDRQPETRNQEQQPAVVQTAEAGLTEEQRAKLAKARETRAYYAEQEGQKQREPQARDPSAPAKSNDPAQGLRDDSKQDEDRQPVGRKEGEVELSEAQRIKLEQARATREYYAQQEAQKDRGDRGGGGGRSGR